MKIIKSIFSTIFDPISALFKIDKKQSNNFVVKHPILLWLMCLVAVVAVMCAYYLLVA